MVAWIGFGKVAWGLPKAFGDQIPGNGPCRVSTQKRFAMANFDPVWFGYGALLVLLAASLSARILSVRLGLGAATLLALLPAIRGQGSGGYILLLCAILLVNLGQAARTWRKDAKIRFSAEELDMRQRHFEGLSARATRALIDQGHWISARRGEVLIREDQATPSLFYLADGAAMVRREGVDVGTLEEGALIGEATVLDGGHATGTVTLATNARLWFVPAASLRAWLAANPDVAATLHEGFARALRGKLASANARIADPPSIP